MPQDTPFHSQACRDFVELVFSDIVGCARNVEMSRDHFDSLDDDYVFFDGSSIPGYADVNASDLMLRVERKGLLTLPWDPSVSVALCSVYGVDGRPHPCDPRNVLSRVLEEAGELGVSPVAGCELEFFLVRRSEAGVVPADRGGYFVTPPLDGGVEFRRLAVRTLHAMSVPTTGHHHEVAMGQHEIGIRHDGFKTTADRLLLARIVISELATRQGLIATFMPKPFPDMNGSGLHMHQSLWTTDMRTNLFATDGRPALSPLARHYVAGILEHAPALAALLSSTVNSFKRLAPGFEAPTRIAWGPRNRTTLVRVPYARASSSVRVEIRCPDPLCSPHLAMAATLAAGLHGVREELEPPEPTSEDLYHSEVPGADGLPSALPEALDALSEDTVLRDALGAPLVETFIRLKRREYDEYLASGGHNATDTTRWEIGRYLLLN